MTVPCASSFRCLALIFAAGVCGACASGPPVVSSGGTADAPPGRPAGPPPFRTIEPLATPGTATKSAGFTALEQELARGMTELAKADPPAYFVGYEVVERKQVQISARVGVLMSSSTSHTRVLDAEVRVGGYQLDSTHPVRARSADSGTGSSAALPLDEDPSAVRAVAWRETERDYKTAAERFLQLKTRQAVAVAHEDKSDDFSRETPVVSIQEPATIEVDVPAWEDRLRKLSARFRAVADIHDSIVSLDAQVENRWILTSEGTRIRTAGPSVRVSVMGRTRAEDGMELYRFEAFDAAGFATLAGEADMVRSVDQIVADLRALRKAPLAEPYAGPAILEGRAAAVFFHEIFGHRVEGHRQKDDNEGQTFAKKLGELVMPAFITVYDDPRLERLGDRDLNGSYRFDNEGIAAQRASLVEAGVLKGFLLGRSPTRGFTKSNGHGRRQIGRRVVARQANLVVQPTTAVSRDELHERLRAEARRQNKTYGLLFKDISGGFTFTGRGLPQAFKVSPILVYRVYTDGRPDELVRGADIVGTPLTSLTKILAASDDYQIFNGFCGAESGFIPVSGVSPSLLVGQIEIERKAKGQDKPPVLPAPVAAEGGAQ